MKTNVNLKTWKVTWNSYGKSYRLNFNISTIIFVFSIFASRTYTNSLLGKTFLYTQGQDRKSGAALIMRKHQSENSYSGAKINCTSSPFLPSYGAYFPSSYRKGQFFPLKLDKWIFSCTDVVLIRKALQKGLFYVKNKTN